MNWKAVSFLVGVLMAGSILGDTTPPAGPTNLASAEPRLGHRCLERSPIQE